MSSSTLAPCGHPGIRVIGSYITCPRCDAMPNREHVDPTRYIMCPRCRTLDVAPELGRKYKCLPCGLVFEPTAGNQP